MSRSLLRRVSPAIVAAAFGAMGCGHPASEAECEEIVERVARLELEKKNPGNAQAVADEIEATKKSVRESMLKECVGRRITEKAMTCVRNAKTSKEVVEDCFD
ncbi:MAG: hypothetical protein IPM35_33205 [Myxococcales bacterium]|nr:hypothetical protein [Myxococcales bacterium]